MNLLDVQYKYNPTMGHFIDAKHQRIVEIIKDYNPELDVVYMPENILEPYTVVHFKSDGQQYPLFHLSRKDMDDGAAVLTRIFANDMSKHTLLDMNTMIDLAERAEDIIKAKEEMDAREERADLAKHILKSQLHTYRYKVGEDLRVLRS